MSIEGHVLTKEQIDELNKLKQDTSDNGREIFQMYALDLLVELHSKNIPPPPPPKECDQYEIKDIETGKCRGPMLPLDGREQFHKGASTDPNDWKVVPMRDDPSLFKIVDNDNINVADKFATQQNAEMFITHYLWLRMKEEKCAEVGKKFDPVKNECIDKEEPKPEGDKIYPDSTPPHYCDEVIDGGIEQDGDRREPQIMCGYNFLNTEATAFIKVKPPVNDTLSIKLRGPKHSGIPDNDMCNNIHYVSLGNENKKPFGKQSGHTQEYCEFGSPVVKVPDNVWVGVKAIEWNSSDGKSVHFQTWIQNPEGSEWKLAAETIDDGNTGCGDSDPRAKIPYTESPCQGVKGPVSIGYRVDGLKAGGDVEFKNLSVREIKPPVDQPPQPPGTSTTKDGVTIPFKVKEFKYDHNDRGTRYDFRHGSGTSMVMIGYFKTSGNDDVSAKILGGRHSDSAKYDGCCYIPAINTSSGGGKFRVECPHPDYGDVDLDFEGNGKGYNNGFVGTMAVAIQKPDGVIIQMWQDQGDNDGDKPANEWVKVLEVFDDGNKARGIDGADRFPLRELPDSAQNTWRIDTNNDAKWLAVGELDI